MADAKTEQEWEKSKRIEEERMKAVRNLNTANASKANAISASFLDPSLTRKKGYRRDPDAIMMSAEKFANAGAILAVAGAVLVFIGVAGGAVAQINELGAGGAIISGLPGSLGAGCIAVAVICALVGIISSFVFCKQIGKKSSTALRTSIITLIIVFVFILAKFMLRI